MSRSRALRLLTACFGVVVVTLACASQKQVGEECLKNDDCETKRCIQYICVDPNAAKLADSGATAADTAEAAVEAAAPDTAEAAVDTAAAPEAAAEAGGD